MTTVKLTQSAEVDSRPRVVTIRRNSDVSVNLTSKKVSVLPAPEISVESIFRNIELKHVTVDVTLFTSTVAVGEINVDLSIDGGGFGDGAPVLQRDVDGGSF